MGLIRAAVGAVGGTMADQWREFFYCEAMDADTLVVKGQKILLEKEDSRLIGHVFCA